MAVELQPYRDSAVTVTPPAQYPDREKIQNVVEADRKIFKVESGALSTSTEKTMRNGCATLAALALLGAIGTAIVVGVGMHASFAGGMLAAGAMGLAAIAVKLAMHSLSTHSKIKEKEAKEDDVKAVFEDASQYKIGQIIGDVDVENEVQVRGRGNARQRGRNGLRRHVAVYQGPRAPVQAAPARVAF